MRDHGLYIGGAWRTGGGGTAGAVSPSTGETFATVAVLGSVIGNFFLFTRARRGGEYYLRKRSSSPRSQRFRRWFD